MPKSFTDEFIANYSHQFGKLPPHADDVHRSLEQDENLDNILTTREYRATYKNIIFQYDKIFHLIKGTLYLGAIFVFLPQSMRLSLIRFARRAVDGK